MISSESLLGGVYIALSPGGETETLQPGQAITVTQGAISLHKGYGTER
jgi:phospholipid/cholesterol/gamma-HCH transport system substrate-binding protein